MRRHAWKVSGVRVRRAVAVLIVLPVLVLCVAAAVQTEPPPATARANPEWVTVNLDHSSQRYVDLDQINPKNVGTLTKVCEFDLNYPAWFSSGLLMVDGVIYVNTVASTYAVDATNCSELWRYDIQFTPWIAAVGNRGAAYHDGMVFRGTADGRVIALDAKTGALRWQNQAANSSRSEAFTSAPIAFEGKLFIGIVTADLNVRGRLMAFDTSSGKELWRFNTIPVGIDPGAETWPPPQAGGVPPAGGAFWTSYSLDPASGEVFGPVSNPNPDYVRTTGGLANLYTNSVISLDSATGNLKWYCQTVAGDTHDWDLGTQPTLYRTKSGRDMLAIAGKEGYVYGIDRKGSAVEAMCQKPIVFRTPGTRVPAQPEPAVDETLRLVCPGTVGGAQWNGTAYHPGLGILYSGMVDFCTYYSSTDYAVDPGFWSNAAGDTLRPDFSTPPRGWITAMDGETGKVLWKHQTQAQVLAGLVPTKSGLLFGGDVHGNLLAFDARSGKVLNTISTGGALNHGLISYAVAGRQYVAAAAGGVTLNPAGNPIGTSSSLRVVIYGLPGGGQRAVQKRVSAKPRRIPLISSASDAPPVYGAPTPAAAGTAVFSLVCGGCHGMQAQGGLYPPLLRHTELADSTNDFQVLKNFLSSVPPPMPILYPGMLSDADVEHLGVFLQTLLSNPKNPQLANSSPPGTIYQQPTSGGTPAWQSVYSVLTSPRCINCHTITNYPRQTDIRYPHIYSIVRGTDDHGAPVGRCHHCHGKANNPERGIPGADGWHIAPLSMSWESAPGVAMSGPELCTMLKDRLRNGDRGFEELREHLKTPLVQWAWHPGTRWNGVARTTPPITFDAFTGAFSEWAEAGGPCPTQ